MSNKTAIQWCDYTWSPWLGCRKVSPGCENCYITTTTPFRTRHIKHGAQREQLSEAYWKQPRRWNDEPLIMTEKRDHRRPRVFPSLCDPFDDEVSLDWFVRFYGLVMTTPNLNWLLLTKRPENVQPRMQAFAQKCLNADWVGPLPDNVWLGVSVEDQKRADERVPILLTVPASVMFLSVEPMLENINLRRFFCHSIRCEKLPGPGMNGGEPCRCQRPDWVIAGGESGRNARPCNIEWVRDVVRQCKNASVPCFVKQLGSDPRFNTTGLDACEHECEILNSPMSLRHSKGGDPSEWPEDLRVRQFPELA